MVEGAPSLLREPLTDGSAEGHGATQLTSNE